MYTLHYRPVLDDDVFRLGDIKQVLETLGKEICLKVVGPPLYILVVVFKVWVVCDGLVFGSPSVMLGEHSCQSGLSAAYISGDSYMHDILDFIMKKQTVFPKSGKTVC